MLLLYVFCWCLFGGAAAQQQPPPRVYTPEQLATIRADNDAALLLFTVLFSLPVLLLLAPVVWEWLYWNLLWWPKNDNTEWRM